MQVGHVSFYCENCGKGVGPNARVCPHCGRFFSAVKCPACNFSGEVALFLAGCPNCGYTGAGRSEQRFEVVDLGRGGRARRSGRSAKRYWNRERGERPRWLFALTMSILAASFLVLVWIYLRL